MTDQKRKRKVARGRDVKKRKTYLLEVSPGVFFRMRRIDLPTLFLEGIIPTPLLSAVDRLQEIRRNVANDHFKEAFESITREERRGFMELVRRAAVASTIEPTLTHSKAESLRNDDAIWVGGFSDVPGEEGFEQDGDVGTSDLLMIWKAVMGEVGIITMSDDDADEFRESESLPVDSPVRDGIGVRTEAVVVVPHAGSAEGETTEKRVRLDYH